MNVITLINKKGGVAKTTTALALASGLSKRGFKVLAIDCDAQGNFSKASGGENDVVGIYDVLTGKEDINDAVQELESYDLIGADKRLSNIDVALNKPGREYQLKKALKNLKKNYDFCVIDNPPALNVAVANTLVAGSKAIICTSAETFAVDGLMELSSSLDDVQEFMNPELKIDGILITMFNPRTVIGQHQQEQYLDLAVDVVVYPEHIRRGYGYEEDEGDEHQADAEDPEEPRRERVRRILPVMDVDGGIPRTGGTQGIRENHDVRGHRGRQGDDPVGCHSEGVDVIRHQHDPYEGHDNGPGDVHQDVEGGPPKEVSCCHGMISDMG